MDYLKRGRDGERHKEVKSFGGNDEFDKLYSFACNNNPIIHS